MWMSHEWGAAGVSFCVVVWPNVSNVAHFFAHLPKIVELRRCSLVLLQEDEDAGPVVKSYSWHPCLVRWLSWWPPFSSQNSVHPLACCAAIAVIVVAVPSSPFRSMTHVIQMQSTGAKKYTLLFMYIQKVVLQHNHDEHVSCYLSSR